MSETASVDDLSEPDALDARMLRVMMAAAAYQARRVGRTLGLSGSDRQDAEQQVLLALLERQKFFDVTRGPWTPFVHRVARQAAQGVADAYADHLRRRGPSLDQDSDRDDDRDAAASPGLALADPSAPGANDILYLHALHRFLEILPPDLRLVTEAALVAEGHLAEAQRASGLSTSEFYRRLREIRYRLMAVGLADLRFLDAP